MDPEEREILERVLKLSEQNNRILRSMKRSVLVGRIMHMLYWIVIIAISVVSYYYIKPYLGSITQALDLVQQLR